MSISIIGIFDIAMFIGFIIPVIIWGRCRSEYGFYIDHKNMVTATGSTGNSAKVDGFPYITTQEFDSLKSRHDVSLGFWITFLVFLLASIGTTILSYSPATVAALHKPIGKTVWN